MCSVGLYCVVVAFALGLFIISGIGFKYGRVGADFVLQQIVLVCIRQK